MSSTQDSPSTACSNTLAKQKYCKDDDRTSDPTAFPFLTPSLSIKEIKGLEGAPYYALLQPEGEKNCIYSEFILT